VSENKENPIDVIEEVDGSAVVELPEGEEPIEQEEHHEDDQPTTSDMSEDEKEAVREANRQRRHAKKQYAKEKRNAEKAQLDYLKRQNQELMDRLSVIERKSYNNDLSRLDSAIQDEAQRMQYAQALIREATENSDGNAMIKAQEAYIASRDRLREMQEFRKQAEHMPEPEKRVDPRMIDMAKDWMARNPWYDPSGKDEDSQIAKLIDERMVSEGWDPTGDDYWEEFDNRLQRRLPNRYTEPNDERRRRPKSFVTGSVRESVGSRNSGGGYVLSPERVRAIKEAGMWDDPDKRQRMIKQFIQYDKTNRS
jgi:hypothetical protein